MSEGLYFLQGAEEKKKGIHYEVDLKKKLGEGGMGRVFFGYRVDEARGTRKEVAVKFLYGNLKDEEINRARREASIQLRNDNLVEMFGLVELQSTDQAGAPILRLHVVSEYLNGVTLQDLMNGIVTDKFGNPIDKAQEFLDQYTEKRERFAVNVLKNVLSGIMALHDAGYIHRDIDPSNIMLTDDGHIKLIDFGVAHKLVDLRSESPTIGGTVVGTFIGKPAYAAPEIVDGRPDKHNETTDIYALGILFFQLLTGHLPFTGTQIEVLHAQAKSPLPLNEIKDERLREIIKKATEKEQENRFGSAAEFRVALDRFRSLRPNSATLPTSSKEKHDDPYAKTNLEYDPQNKETIVNKNSIPPLPYANNYNDNNENKTVFNDIDYKPYNKSNNKSYTWWYVLAALAGIATGIGMHFLM